MGKTIMISLHNKKILLVRNDNIGDLICTTPVVEALRKKYPQSQIDIVVNSYNYCAIVNNPFNPENFNREVERKKLNIKNDEIAIGIISIVRQFKRHDLFINAAEVLIGKYDNLKFFIAGDGPKLAEIKLLVDKKCLNKNIIFLGYVSNPENILAALDIFALTSDSKEGVPQSVIQALLMNKKTLATDVGGTSDLLNDSNLELIKPGCVEEIIKGIEVLIAKKDNRNARNYILENFSKKVMVSKITMVYKKLKVLY